jgi:Holliday junction resolvasome RuvABC ATP-dependent DNA helicase subunit
MGAAAELAKFSRLNPAEGLKLLHAARARAVATDRETVSTAVVAEVVQRLGLYDLGLSPRDVAVLKLLAERGKRGAGAAEIGRALGIATTTYTELLEPYLRALGFVETLSRRVITETGLQYLARLDAVHPQPPGDRP